MEPSWSPVVVEPHAAVHDRRFQDQLLDELARFTAMRLV
jgi:hypothetical protein